VSLNRTADYHHLYRRAERGGGYLADNVAWWLVLGKEMGGGGRW